MVQHNVPFAAAEHFSPLLKECFPDSLTAKNYKSSSTKATCIINEAVAPYFKNQLVTTMRSWPFILITDGSNDTGAYIFYQSLTQHTYTHIQSYLFLKINYVTYHKAFCHFRMRENESAYGQDI